jgi:hypothetical protein
MGGINAFMPMEVSADQEMAFMSVKNPCVSLTLSSLTGPMVFSQASMNLGDGLPK